MSLCAGSTAIGAVYQSLVDNVSVQCSLSGCRACTIWLPLTADYVARMGGSDRAYGRRRLWKRIWPRCGVSLSSTTTTSSVEVSLLSGWAHSAN